MPESGSAVHGLASTGYGTSLREKKANVKHLFDSLSTSATQVVIVHVFVEHVYDKLDGGKPMSTLMVAAETRYSRSHVRPLELVQDAPGAQVYDIRQAPSERRRRELLAAESPSMRRRPKVVRQEQAATRPAFARALLSAAGVLSLTVAAWGLGLALQPAGYEGPTRTVSVSAGESVWSLAATVATDRPLDEVVTDIEHLNQISGGLQPGQQILLPVR